MNRSPGLILSSLVGGLLTPLLVGGCASPSPTTSTTSRSPAVLPPRVLTAEEQTIRRASLQLPASEGEAALSIESLLDLAARHNPDLGIARARADSARGKLVQAGLYPNPVLTYDADNLGDNRNAAGSQGPIFSQTIVRGGKLDIARAAAAQGVAATDWQALTRWFDVLTGVRTAYFEALLAQEEVRVNDQIVRLAEQSLIATERLQKAGVGNQPDVLQAKVEWHQRAIDLDTSRRRHTTALQQLATAIGVSTLACTTLEGSLEAPPPEYAWEPMLARVLSQSSEIQAAQANYSQMEQLLLRAKAEAVSDVTLAVQPFYSFPESDTRVQVTVSMPVPVFNRNQGNIRSTQADLASAQEETRKTELSLTQRLTDAFQRNQIARKQKETYEKQILPDAEESLRLVRLGYERGDAKYDFATVLLAQRTLVQARLAHVRALGEVWRSASVLMGLLQTEEDLARTKCR